MKKKVLFIDRDGTLVIEPPVDYQLDSLEKLEFYPKVFRNLGFIRSKLDFEFVMVTNQDGLGTSSFSEETFWPAHNLMLKTLAGEGITFDDILIDRSMPEDCASTRKPRTGMLTKYISNPEYDLEGSFVIGDRPTDVELAKNIGCRAIYLQESIDLLKEKGLDIDYTKQPEEDEDKLQTATITVQATPEQAMLLTQYENEGVLHVALISRGNETLAKELLDQQAELLKTLYVNPEDNPEPDISVSPDKETVSDETEEATLPGESDESGASETTAPAETARQNRR